MAARGSVSVSHGPRSSYMRSIEEVRRWLNSTNLEEFIYILLDNGYDDLDAISHMLDAELEEMQALFPDKVHRHKMRFMVGHLRNMGIGMWRKDGLPDPPDDWDTPLHIDTVGDEPPAPHKGFLSMRIQGRTALAGELSNDWADRFCVWKGTTLSWYKSRMAAMQSAEPEGGMVIPATSSSRFSTSPVNAGPGIFAVEFPSASSVRINYGSAWYGFDADGDFGDWQPIFEFIRNHCLAPTSPSMLSTFEQMQTLQEIETDSVKPRSLSMAQHENAMRKVLINGSDFQKYKHSKKPKRRRVWCTANLDKVVWGPIKGTEKMDVKGFISVADITKVDTGFGSSLRLYLVTEDRTLDLEAPDPLVHNEWHGALSYLLQKRAIDEKEWQIQLGTPRFAATLCRLWETHVVVLTQGTIFRKFKRKSAKMRRIQLSADLNRLEWVDQEKEKVQGYIECKDMVEIVDQLDLQFVVQARERNLELQAQDRPTKVVWMDALTFFLSYRHKISSVRKASDEHSDMR